MKLRAVAVACVLVVLTLAYVRVGWWRLEDACQADPPGGPAFASAATSWSWRPPGFTCEHDDEPPRTRLWW
ncbi:hypothetical protein [Cellulomonas sp. PhB150]|uniref:hypothetical protein n=1 Tax=Cellulomonas sp. PhB150 TaxID=2485188 RepID=UPI000F49DAEF|nr:hypothetical protein [Cellulomonas sp. PhB150]ROS27939.1 hypothetical protein EDF34_1732 [Cellulomonas sp. PhB150]